NQPPQAVLSVLQTISNFSSGPNEFIEVLLNADLLNNIWWYLSPDTHHQLRRNAMLTISNLAAGHEQIVRKVVHNENIMQYVIAHLHIPGHIYHQDTHKWVASINASNPESTEEWRIVKESLWVLSNITTLADNDCICALLRNYTNMIQLLSRLLHYPRLPEPICLKVVDVLLRIVDRTNKISELTPPVEPSPRNSYAEEMINEGVMPELNYLCLQIESQELMAQVELLHAALLASSPMSSQASGLASAFGLPTFGNQLSGPNVRRIVHGYEDGDVRLIEDAINSIKIGHS
ncbi:hypothetical protein CU098_007919, partial [Rhizopus stolonifer]